MIPGAATLEPFRQLSLSPSKPAHKTLSVSPATSVFTGGLTGALRRGEIWMSVVSLTNVLSKITPTLLSNIPFNPIQTWDMHLACAWASVSCLALMSLVLVYGLVFVKRPKMMPIDPGSLAGRMYYLCDSGAVVEGCQGLSTLSRKEIDARLRLDRNSRYRFGKMVGTVSGEERIGVDVAYGHDR